MSYSFFNKIFLKSTIFLLSFEVTWLFYYLFIFEYSPRKLAIFRPLMKTEASSLGLTKGFALGPYEGVLVPYGPLHQERILRVD